MLTSVVSSLMANEEDDVDVAEQEEEDDDDDTFRIGCFESASSLLESKTPHGSILILCDIACVVVCTTALEAARTNY